MGFLLCRLYDFCILMVTIQYKMQMLLEVMLRANNLDKYQVLPMIWIAKRDFAWFGNYRRLNKDFEFQSNTSEDMIQLDMICLLQNNYKM